MFVKHFSRNEELKKEFAFCVLNRIFTKCMMCCLEIVSHCLGLNILLILDLSDKILKEEQVVLEEKNWFEKQWRSVTSRATVFEKGPEPGLISYGRRNSVYAAVHKETNSKRNSGGGEAKRSFRLPWKRWIEFRERNHRILLPPECRFIHLTRRGKRIDDRIARIRSLAFCAAALKQLN